VGIVVLALVAGAFGLYRWASTRWTAAPAPPGARCEARIGGATASLTIEQATNASIIAGLAAQRGLAPRAVSIALTTAFQESGIRNLDYGDRDSLGMFQQRPSQGWGTPEQVMDPYYSTAKFFDVMVTVTDWPTADIGDVAQAVQRSGFPDAYDKHIETAKKLASALAGETPAAWSCLVRDPGPAAPDQLLDALTRAYGGTITAAHRPADGTTPATLTLTAASEPVAWSAGAFAQSWATTTGVTAVTVGGSGWTAAANALSGWIDIPGSTAAPTTVVVTF
jgi:hypothetical protein